jgi:hypothetical protein
MKIDEIKKRKTPIVVIDKALNKLNDVVLFPEKVEKANQMLKEIGLPKKIVNSTTR